jgi:hypothetical protein
MCERVHVHVCNGIVYNKHLSSDISHSVYMYVYVYMYMYSDSVHLYNILTVKMAIIIVK